MSRPVTTVTFGTATDPSASLVLGPGWTPGLTGRFAGRYPLAVERHAMAQVGRLVPGITTVTPHARYYTLHALVSAEVQSRRLVPAEAVRLLRRCEVVLGAVSTVHHDPHAGMAQAHGADKIRTSLGKHGSVDVESLAAPQVYAQAKWGFWGPYLGSETLLDLVYQSHGTPKPGRRLDETAVRLALGDVLALAARTELTTAVARPRREWRRSPW